MCTMSLELLTKTEVSLSKEEYNATESKVEFQLEAFDEKKWTPMRDNMPLSIVSRFDIIELFCKHTNLVAPNLIVLIPPLHTKLFLRYDSLFCALGKTLRRGSFVRQWPHLQNTSKRDCQVLHAICWVIWILPWSCEYRRYYGEGNEKWSKQQHRKHLVISHPGWAERSHDWWKSKSRSRRRWWTGTHFCFW